MTRDHLVLGALGAVRLTVVLVGAVVLTNGQDVGLPPTTAVLAAPSGVSTGPTP